MDALQPCIADLHRLERRTGVRMEKCPRKDEAR